MKIKPEDLHDWYLEAVKNLKPESFNPNAQKPFIELTEEQKFIDRFIADRVNQRIQEMLKQKNKLG